MAISLAALLVLLLGAGAVGGYLLKRQTDTIENSIGLDLKAGADHLTKGKALVTKANSTNDPAPLREAATEFAAARTAFRSAQTRVQTDPTIRQIDSVGGAASAYIAPRRTAVVELAAMGLSLADAGQDGADIDASLLKPANQGLRGGERLIATLKAAEPFIGKITADLGAAKSHADKVDISVLPTDQRTPFIKARDQIQSGLDGMLEFKRLEPVMLALMGAGGPKTYLVLNLDPAELRGSGGYEGSYIEIGASNGQIKLGTSGDTYGIDYPYPKFGSRNCVTPPPPIREAFPDHCWVFGDANFYADFPASARAAQDLYKRETGRSLDGVIGIDFWAVAEMLNVTGPLDIPEYNTRVDGKTFPDEVVHRILTVQANVPGKKTFFPVVAARVLDKLTGLESADWTLLLGHLNTAVTNRHMQVYFNDQSVETEMTRLGWAGQQLTPSDDREVIQEVEANYGGNKANYWLERKFTLELTLDGNKLKHRLQVSLKNQTPPGYEGGQLYRSYFRLYFPSTATDPSAGGLFADKFPSDEKPNGLSLLDGWYQVPAYSTYDRVAFNYTTEADLSNAHHIYWEKQPGTLSDKVHVILKADGHTYTADTDLTQDRVITLTKDGIKVTAGAAGNAKLPVIG